MQYSKMQPVVTFLHEKKSLDRTQTCRERYFSALFIYS